MRAKKRTTKEAASAPVIGTSYKMDGKTYTMRLMQTEGEHATRWLAQRGRPTWSELLRAAHVHARKALGEEPNATAVREVAFVMMREPAAMKRLAMLVKASPGSKRERAGKKNVEAVE